VQAQASVVETEPAAAFIRDAHRPRSWRIPYDLWHLGQCAALELEHTYHRCPYPQDTAALEFLHYFASQLACVPVLYGMFPTELSSWQHPSC